MLTPSQWPDDSRATPPSSRASDRLFWFLVAFLAGVVGVLWVAAAVGAIR